MKVESYKDLIVWQRSIELVVAVYDLTREFPKHELYGLTSQMRRAAVSVPSNIAEGFKRRGLGEYVQFLRIADASASELETQIIIAKKIKETLKLNYSNTENLLLEVQKMLSVLISKLSKLKT